MIRETREICVDGDSLELDPFAFWPDIRSRLVGFGGVDEGENPDYAFHTRYVSCGNGPITFSVRFDGLVAPRGTLILRIHELPEVMGAHARQIALSQTQLVDIVRGDGTVTLPTIAREQNHYALLGYIYGDMSATAKAVSIEVARRSSNPHDSSRPTTFRAGTNRVSVAQQIIGEREGTLVTPVSQLCTLRQVGEPVFEAILDQMGGLPQSSVIDRWEHAYLARVLDRYDVARAGARGLGIGAIDDPLGRWLVQLGCPVTLTTPDVPLADLECPPEVDIRQVDPRAVDGLVGYDFAWASRAGGVGGGDRQTMLRFIEDVLRALKPGGLLTFVMSIDVAPREIGNDVGPIMRRPDVDRIAMVLLSRGHQVAQIAPWGEALAEANDAGTLMVSAFGMVVRKIE